MILTDASVIVALADPREIDHPACVATLAGLSPPMMTTLPALSEATFLLSRGRRSLAPLWALIHRRDLIVHFLDEALLGRGVELMQRYADVPMALADATLVAIAEHLGEDRIFTLDTHFRIYRTEGRIPFVLVP